MCHVLSEGSKWSGPGRPCGLFPCAPRYYYSTPRCPIVYGLVLSSACAWCALLLCVPVSVPWQWCCGCVPCSCALPSAPVPVRWVDVWLCVVLWLSLPAPVCGIPCPLHSLLHTAPVIPAPISPVYMGCIYDSHIPALILWLIFRLAIFTLCSVHIIKAGPWNPNMDFKSRLEFSMFYFAENFPAQNSGLIFPQLFLLIFSTLYTAWV